MSLFRKPKKPNYLRVFSSLSDEDANDNGVEKMVVNENPSKSSNKSDRKSKLKKIKSEDNKPITKSLLSFADDEDEDETFQVKKSSHSKKVMRQMDKERRKKAKNDRNDYDSKSLINENGRENCVDYNTTHSESKTKTTSTASSNSKSNKSDGIQTEIRTDDFVLVVRKSEPENLILNGRAAICAGRNDISDEDEPEFNSCAHRFSKPEGLKKLLESGSIPDAAMIHAARKKRQKAREQGDFIAIEEKEPIKTGNRLIREDPECDGSDEEERVDMNAITGVKEREERREQFYSVENDYSDDDSDHGMNEWENQQIRKGVSGAQLVTAQQESVLSRFMIKATVNQIEESAIPSSTSTLLEQAYSQGFFEGVNTTSPDQKSFSCKPSFLKTPLEVSSVLKSRLDKLKELNEKHHSDLNRISIELTSLQIEDRDCEQNASAAAAKYRFYQEMRGFVFDLIECLDEKAAQIEDLEKRTLNVFAKRANQLIDRRRQDVRDQVKEMAESSKPANLKRGQEYDEQIRRAAEREGRRTRRRCEREKNYTVNSHLDGMSSDDEIADREQVQYTESIEQIEKATTEIFVDACEEYCNINLILSKFETWKKTDIVSYKDAFVSLCLPKVLGLLIRVQMITWYPIGDRTAQEVEKYNWYPTCMLYGWNENETEESLINDADINLVPAIIEKIIVPKLTDIIEKCWDPLSTTQNLRLIRVISRLGRDYPLQKSSKHMKTMFHAILNKMKCALENDVFIPIFPKQIQEAKTSFFQRQICSSLKLLRNFLSWQGIIADQPLIELALSSLLNRYLILAMRVCSSFDALSKANVIVNTLPTVWLQPNSTALSNLHLFITFIKSILESLDPNNPLQIDPYEKAKTILQRLHSS